MFLQASTTYNSFGQCFGSGSAWTSNCFSSPGSGSILGMGIRIQDQGIEQNLKNKHNFHPLKISPNLLVKKEYYKHICRNTQISTPFKSVKKC
jgi:hypothetical protein